MKEITQDLINKYMDDCYNAIKWQLYNACGDYFPGYLWIYDNLRSLNTALRKL